MKPKNKEIEILKEEYYRRKILNDFWEFLLLIDPKAWRRREKLIKDLVDLINKFFTANEKEIQKFKQEDEESGIGYFKMNILMSAFPRFYKTQFAVTLRAWLILRSQFLDDQEPLQILSISSGDKLTKKIHARTTSLLLNDIYVKKLFKIDKKPRINNANEFSFDSNYLNLLATSVSGQSTGNGANVIICDDLYKDHASALSPAINEKTISFYHSAIKNRFEGKRRLELHIGTRWTTKELVSKLIEDNHFHYIFKLRALINGKSVLPEVISTEQLLNFQRKDPLTFNSTYQQDPVDVIDGLFQKDKFIYKNSKEINFAGLSFISIDVADEGDDFYNIIYSQKDLNTGKYVIKDVFHRNDNLETIEESVKKFIRKCKPTFLKIENNYDNTHARMITDYCLTKGIVAFSERTTANKTAKILGAASRILDFVILDDKAGEYKIAVDQLHSWDRKQENKQHDDMADNLAMLSDFIMEYDIEYRSKYNEWSK